MIRGSIAILVLLLLLGCTHVQRGAAVGALVGAGAGAVIADVSSGDVSNLEGAGIGALGGGLLGALIADASEHECLEHASDKLVFENDVLFAPGSARLTQRGAQSLDRVAQTIKCQLPHRMIYVEGHCDSDPIVYSGWRSNWELGAARALAVVHYLQDVHGIEGRRLAATTYSYYQPMADNDWAEGRQENRRAELVIYMKDR